MTNEIGNIFRSNIEALNYSDKTVTYIRLQNYNKALLYSTWTIEVLSKNIPDIITNESYFNEYSSLVDINQINYMFQNLLGAQENDDYILLADLYETLLFPFLISMQQIIIDKEDYSFDQRRYTRNIEALNAKDPDLTNLLKHTYTPIELMEKGYSVEYTSCGLMTLALYDNGKKYYIHSNGNVIHEAGLIARDWFDDDKTEYIIYGLGLGYHVYELMELDETIKIKVFESDINIIKAATAFSDIDKILYSDRVEIVYDPSFDKLNLHIKNLKPDSSFYIYYPSIRNIENNKVKELLEGYFVSYSSIKNQLHKLNNNFKHNILLRDEPVDNIKEKFKGRNLYIIAAGPSLDKNYLELKKIGSNSIILSTGTVLKKLLNAGITPDFAIIIDGNNSVYNQIDGIENIDTPLLYLSTVYYKIPQSYKGKRYFICQEGYTKSEKYAKEKGYSLFYTGGSVVTTALDIGISFECKKIIFVGLDLAYTNSLDHACETTYVNKITDNDLREVEDINGSKVLTSKNMNIYRRWIENRIKDVNNIEIIDATEGGAKIAGMKLAKLRDVVL
ncbi:motility associated factor glycosyltransferase family protein [Anaerocolumna sp.]|uniref:motility associated factor glycosyltransferase family protein n=1 Tax=Anaerocolumna sp. TaxID=2041569 RepID=UPI0028B0C73E|nr:6-hydroxymethylpterin diphosphokinase MptE-like protein [Anaerocolumna sp.]